MLKGFGNNPEKMKGPLKPHENAAEQSKELHKISEQVEGKLENAEVMTTGEVSEDLKEGNSKYSGGGTAGIQTRQHAKPQQIQIPPLEVMRKEVAVEIEKQIHLLQQEAKQMMKNPHKFTPFSLAGVVAKIRELKDILGQLAYATFDTLKTWWLKYVKNITIS